MLSALTSQEVIWHLKNNQITALKAVSHKPLDMTELLCDKNNLYVKYKE